MITYSLSMKSAKETNDLKAFGRRLAELRKAHGFTQETLAEKAGMASHSLALIEQGQRWPRLTSLHRIAKCIGVDTYELIRGLRQ
jgi:transcriptional regulator with XRE-family HTH domain